MEENNIEIQASEATGYKFNEVVDYLASAIGHGEAHYSVSFIGDAGKITVHLMRDKSQDNTLDTFLWAVKDDGTLYEPDFYLQEYEGIAAVDSVDFAYGLGLKKKEIVDDVLRGFIIDAMSKVK